MDFTTTPRTESGVIFYDGAKSDSDGYFKTTTQGGVSCVRAANKAMDSDFNHPKVSTGYLYFKPDHSVVSASDSNVAIAVDYYDAPGMNFYLQYRNTAGETVGAPGVSTTGTNTWKRYVFYLTDAKFDSTNTKLGDGTMDFRIGATNGFSVKRVSVIKAPENRIAKQTITDSTTGKTYYYINLDGKDIVRPYVTQNSWNSKGTKFIFGDADGDVMYEYDIETELYNKLDDANVGSGVMNAVVTPDDKIFYVNKNNGATMCYDWNTGEIKQVYNKCFGVMNVTDDGRYLSGYNNVNSASVVQRYDTQTGELKAMSKNLKADNSNSAGVGHPIINPTNPDLQMFCNEGTTSLIPDRIWVADWSKGESSMKNFYDQTDGAGNQVVCTGHELWSNDGKRAYWVNYQVSGFDVAKSGLMRANADGTGVEQINNEYAHWHCYPSADDKWIASDVNDGSIVITNVQTKKATRIAKIKMINWDHPYQPHPCIARNSDSVSWGMVDDNNVLGVGWTSISGTAK